MESVFYSPTRIIFGEGSLKRVGEEARKFGEKVLIVTGKSSSKKAGSLDEVVNSLTSHNLRVEVFNKVEPDPSVETVEEGAKFAKKCAVEVVIGLGGGSSMDAAKGIALLMTNKGSITDYFGTDKVKEAAIPVIAIPTTAGTGSEVTKYAVVTERKKMLKQIIGSFHISPVLAILDPMLTLSMPASLTANTGADALSHAIESYVCTKANPVSDILALESIRLIAEALPGAVSQPENIEVRKKMLFASSIAGIALTSSGAGIIHGMGYSITLYYGLANALLMPEAMEFNLVANPSKYKNIAAAMGKKVEGLLEKDAARLSVVAVRELSEKIGIPRGLKEIGVKEESLAGFAETVGKNERVLSLNPRRPSTKEIEEIYRKSM
ncbi:MAG: iron-containing alcohol dehydrogenase [Elusimicrobiota bacterium]|nr:iron-containing alcohol dehydrogenase [Elusimicrobiota bacterium]